MLTGWARLSDLKKSFISPLSLPFVEEVEETAGRGRILQNLLRYVFHFRI